ncbi:hypothetical protein V6N13_148346 [Hibiscus sabdariffa]
MIGEDATTKEKTQLSRRGDMVVGEESESSKELFTGLKRNQGLQLYVKSWVDLKQSLARTLEEIGRSDDQGFYLP